MSDCKSSTGALFIGINGIMVSVFASSTVDRGQSPDKDETLRIGLVQLILTMIYLNNLI